MVADDRGDQTSLGGGACASPPGRRSFCCLMSRRAVPDAHTRPSMASFAHHGTASRSCGDPVGTVRGLRREQRRPFVPSNSREFWAALGQAVGDPGVSAATKANFVHGNNSRGVVRRGIVFTDGEGHRKSGLLVPFEIDQDHLTAFRTSAQLELGPFAEELQRVSAVQIGSSSPSAAKGEVVER